MRVIKIGVRVLPVRFESDARNKENTCRNIILFSNLKFCITKVISVYSIIDVYTAVKIISNVHDTIVITTVVGRIEMKIYSTFTKTNFAIGYRHQLKYSKNNLPRTRATKQFFR